MSVSHLDNEGFSTSFHNGLAHITLDGKVLLVAQRKNDLYHLNLSCRQDRQANLALTSQTLHRRLGHFALRKLRPLGDIVDCLDPKLLDGLPEKINCDSCVRAKSKRTSWWESGKALDGLSATYGISGDVFKDEDTIPMLSGSGDKRR